MTSHVEESVFADLLATLAARGFQVVPNPTDADIPPFLEGYRPDAVARRGSGGAVIAVRTPGRGTQAVDLARVAQLVRGQPGWDLVVVHGNERPVDTVRIDCPTPAQIDRAIARIPEVRGAAGEDLAFLSAWITLEALARYVDRQEGGRLERVLSPVQVVERLAASGCVDRRAAARLRTLAALRSRLVHGGLDVEVAPEDVDFMLDQLVAIHRTAAIEPAET